MQSFSNLLSYFKLIISIVLALLLWVNSRVDPTDFVKLEESASVEGVRAGMFAMIAAVALFLNVMPSNPTKNMNYGLTFWPGLWV